MSVAICRSSTASLPLEKEGFGSILMPTSFTSSNTDFPTMIVKNEQVQEAAREEVRPPEQVDIWSSIQARKANQEPKDEPYIHPLVRRSSSLLSQKSLEICTESLGSETGSDDYFSSEDDMDYLFSSSPKKQELVVQQQQQEYDDDDDNDVEEEEESDNDEYVEVRKKEQVTVNYHCSIGRRSPTRSFPPPLPSISRRDGPCLQMRPHRKDGRLVVEAVTVPSQNYLHAERQGGRLLLSFIRTATNQKNINTNTDTAASEMVEQEEEEEVAVDDEDMMEMEDQEEEEEVEVVDRGTVVEVKVSTQPQQQIGGAATMKVHRSSIVINKFVSFMLPNENETDHHHHHRHHHHQPDDTANYPITTGPTKRTTTSTTTAAAAAVAASSLSTFPADGNHQSFDNKLLFTSKRRNREELLRNMRRCSQLRKPLFIWEPCCIATSS